jgi:hypothetical protein
MKRMSLRRAFLIAAFAGSILHGSCTCSDTPGTYSDRGGAITLELKSGGKATLTFMGDPASCIYKVDGKKLLLDCKKEKLTFTIHDDGSLTGPPETGMPALRKSKS